MRGSATSTWYGGHAGADDAVSLDLFCIFPQGRVAFRFLLVFFAHHGVKTFNISHGHAFLGSQASTHGQQNQHALGWKVVHHLKAGLCINSDRIAHGMDVFNADDLFSVPVLAKFATLCSAAQVFDDSACVPAPSGSFCQQSNRCIAPGSGNLGQFGPLASNGFQTFDGVG